MKLFIKSQAQLRATLSPFQAAWTGFYPAILCGKTVAFSMANMNLNFAAMLTV